MAYTFLHFAVRPFSHWKMPWPAGQDGLRDG